jgi:hypothetical protein
MLAKSSHVLATARAADLKTNRSRFISEGMLKKPALE